MLAPANVRVDAWVTPPLYTGKPPVILSAANKDAASPDSGAPLPVPAGSTLLVRSSGGTIDVVVGGGVTEVAPSEQAPKGTNERHFKIAGDGTAHVRAPAGQPQWKFAATPDRAPTHFAGQGSGTPGPRLAADVLQARGRLRRHRSARAIRRPQRDAAKESGRPRKARTRRPTRPSRGRCSSRRSFRWCCRMRAPATASARP